MIVEYGTFNVQGGEKPGSTVPYVGAVGTISRVNGTVGPI